MDRLLEVFFLPPMAVARVGSAGTPLESFEWADDRSAHGGTQTVVRPAVTFEVAPDGSLRPYLPPAITFKDPDGAVRPVAPFFELWATIQHTGGGVEERPVDLDLLSALGLTTADVRIRVTAGNQKASRRTGDAACSFTAEIAVQADDHRRHALEAFSRHTSGQQPLVFPEQPIPVGSFQVMRPEPRVEHVAHRDIDLAILRVRFTPPAGRVYGPATATTGPASPVQPGQWEAPAAEFGRIHEIVPPENRMLNDRTPWSTDYVMMTGKYEDPQPQDGYDGANVGDNRSWGAVDDVSDAVIEAHLAWRGQRFTALARVFTGPPDFAPDRRPIYSIADDLADRDLPVPAVTEATYDEARRSVVDLFQRAFETSSLLNLDAARARALVENDIRRSMAPGIVANEPPKTGPGSMTVDDRPYASKVPVLTAPQPVSPYTNAVDADPTPYASTVTFVHAQMMDDVMLLDFLRRQAPRVRMMVRPPFASVGELPERPAGGPDPGWRDPRVFRDLLHDMRMPPYMRDANLFPLSITRRQYRELMAFLDILERRVAASQLHAGAHHD
jgi:hypothetical protein